MGELDPRQDEPRPDLFDPAADEQLLDRLENQIRSARDRWCTDASLLGLYVAASAILVGVVYWLAFSR